MVAITSDMGTELALSDFTNVDLAGWLGQSGMTWSSVQGDDDMLFRPQRAPSQFLFTNCLPVPGLLHVLHNAVKELSTHAMQEWASGLEALKKMNFFLTKFNYKERFVEKCLAVAAPQHAPTFQKKFTTILDWRFAVVQTFLDELLPLRKALPL